MLLWRCSLIINSALKNTKYLMATMDIISRLESRATEAQSLITSLKSEIANLSKLANENSMDNECQYLIKENENLEKEIELMKEKLIAAERANGKYPVSMKSDGSTENDVNIAKCIVMEPQSKVVSENSNSSTSTTNTASKSNPKPEKSAKKKPADPKPKSDSKKESADDQVDVGRLDIRIGRITSVNKHPDADSLYVESVNLGEEKERTVVSGLVRFIERQDLEGRLVVLLCNLKPAKMRGVTSEAMVLCASTPEKVEVLNPPSDSAPGDVVTCEGFDLRPDAVLNPKKKVWETVAADLKVDSSGVATYKGKPLTVLGKGIIKSTDLTNVQIK